MKGTSQTPPTKIFVGGLPTDAKKQELEEFLEEYAPIAEITIKPRHNNPDLNLGFAILAIDCVHSYQNLLDMRRVKFKGKLIEFKPFLEGKKLEKMLNNQDERRLMLIGLPSIIEERDLVSFLKGYGAIDNFYFVKDFKSKLKTGNAVVIFSNSKSAVNLQKGSPFLTQGSVIHVRRIENNQAKIKRRCTGGLEADEVDYIPRRGKKDVKTARSKRQKRGNRNANTLNNSTNIGYQKKSEVNRPQGEEEYNSFEDRHTKMVTRRGEYSNSFQLQCILEELKKGAWQSSHRVYNIRLNRRDKQGGKHKARRVRRRANQPHLAKTAEKFGNDLYEPRPLENLNTPNFSIKERASEPHHLSAHYQSQTGDFW